MLIRVALPLLFAIYFHSGKSLVLPACQQGYAHEALTLWPPSPIFSDIRRVAEMRPQHRVQQAARRATSVNQLDGDPAVRRRQQVSRGVGGKRALRPNLS